jgi:hypothetical protein
MATDHWITILDDFMNGNKRFERLHFIRKKGCNLERSPKTSRRFEIVRIKNALFVIDIRLTKVSHHKVAAAKTNEVDYLLLTCFCFGAVSSGLVAFFTVIDSS